MQTLPHQYQVQAKAQAESNLQVHVANLADLTVAPPSQFGGPGDQWSPEDLLVASVVSCFILSFRAIARASNFKWELLDCDAQGELDKLAGTTQFIKFAIKAKLTIAAGESSDKAERLLNKAEQSCLITNSLSAESHLECEINIKNE